MNERFTPAARKAWDAIEVSDQTRILDNVWCGYCVGPVTMIKFSGRVGQGDLILEGLCASCGREVGRLIENE